MLVSIADCGFIWGGSLTQCKEKSQRTWVRGHLVGVTRRRRCGDLADPDLLRSDSHLSAVAGIQAALWVPVAQSSRFPRDAGVPIFYMKSPVMQVLTISSNVQRSP